MPETQQPFRYTVKAIEMNSFDGTNTMNLRNQVMQLDIYQSIFSPFMKAELMIHDEIGLFFNFPMIGEELVKVVVEQPAQNDFEGVEEQNFYFMVDDVRGITVDDVNQSATYIMSLISVEAYTNSKRKVSETYYGTISDIVEQVYDKYLVALPNDELSWSRGPKALDVERTLEYRAMVCPSMNPVRFINLLRKFAVPDVNYSGINHGAKYVFYEDIDGFHFKSVESMMEDPDAKALAERPQRKFAWVSDKVMLEGRGSSNEYRSITNIRYNKRFSTMEKIVAGYFENVYFEMDLSRLGYTGTGHQHKWNDNSTPKLDRWSMNTKKYIEDVRTLENDQLSNININTAELANRVYYGFNNYGISSFPPAVKNTWGQQQETSIGLSQIDVNIAVSGDSRYKIGDIIYCELPEISGFTDIPQEEPYVSGYFLISELRQSLTLNGDHTTTMGINKNSFANFISLRNNYNV